MPPASKTSRRAGKPLAGGQPASLDVRQWLICLAVALSIIVVCEIRKAVRRHAAPGRQPAE